jgi:hypothetical protein
MIESIGLIGLGVLVVVSACFGHYHKSWKSPWQVARWGLLMMLAGGAMLLIDLLW